MSGGPSLRRGDTNEGLNIPSNSLGQDGKRAMIPREIFTSFDEFQGIVSVNDFRIPVWLQGIFCKFIWFSWEDFGLARTRLDTFGAQVLHHYCKSMIVSRFTIVTENFVICFYQVSKIFSTKYGSAIASSAWSPLKFWFLSQVSQFRA